VKAATSGGAGLLKFGPTAQPANNRRRVAPIRRGGCDGRLGLIRIGGSGSTAMPGSVGDRGGGCTLMGKRLWAKAPTIASGADRRPSAEAPGSYRRPYVKKHQAFGWTLVAMDIAEAEFQSVRALASPMMQIAMDLAPVQSHCDRSKQQEYWTLSNKTALAPGCYRVTGLIYWWQGGN
jgi:hypothetical protein